MAADRRLCGRPGREHASGQWSRDLSEKQCLLVFHKFCLYTFIVCERCTTLAFAFMHLDAFLDNFDTCRPYLLFRPGNEILFSLRTDSSHLPCTIVLQPRT